MNRINFPFREYPLPLTLMLTEFADKYSIRTYGINMYLHSLLNSNTEKRIKLVKEDVGITLYLKENIDKAIKEITAYCNGVGLGLKRLTDADAYTLGDLDQYMLGEIPSQFADWIMIDNPVISANALSKIFFKETTGIRIASESLLLLNSKVSLGEIKSSANIVSAGTERGKTLSELSNFTLEELDEQPITFFVFSGLPLIITAS